MDLDKALNLVAQVLAQLKLSKAEHAELDKAMMIIENAAKTGPVVKQE